MSPHSSTPKPPALSRRGRSSVALGPILLACIALAAMSHNSASAEPSGPQAQPDRRASDANVSVDLAPGDGDGDGDLSPGERRQDAAGQQSGDGPRLGPTSALLSAPLGPRTQPARPDDPAIPAEQAMARFVEPHERFTRTTPPTTVPPPSPPAPTVPQTAAAPAGPTATNPVAGASRAGVVFDVNTPAAWDDAVRRARPGDTIKLVRNIGRPLRYLGPAGTGSGPRGANGLAGNPIVITAAPNVWIDPGDLNNRVPALDVVGAAHVHVVGVRVRNSQFGIRLLRAEGSSQSPLRVANNRVVDVGHAGIHVAGDLEQHRPSRHIRVESNIVTRTGRTAPEFGEGIYLGFGTTEWVDRSHDLAVVGNDISFTTAEGVDIKPGTRNVTVAGNRIHDLSPISGGAISAHYVGVAPNPDPSTSGNVNIRRNRIWNINLDGRPGSNDWAIWVGHGGVTIEANTIWGMRNDPLGTRAVRVRALHGFGPHPIRIVDNVMWTAAGWVAEGEPSGAGLVRASNNRGPAGAPGIEVAVPANPAIPPLGSGGTADSGAGPGSALGHTP